MTQDLLNKLFNSVDRKRGSYLQLLKEAISIRSVTGDLVETKNVISWAENKLKEMGASTILKDAGSVEVDGRKLKLPPILVADIKSESSKVTLFVYGHLDVRPFPAGVEQSIDGSDPYSLEEQNGVLFGQGVVDSKGPLLCWLNAIDAYKGQGVDIPINIRFVIEANKESGSIGLMNFLEDNRESLFKGVSYVCISDSSCLATNKPVITYGTRGCCKFLVSVVGGNTDLHSGCHGGMVSEPMTDLVYLLSNLTNNKGEVLIPNIRDNIEEVTPEEEKYYHNLTFDVAEFKKDIGVDRLLHKENKKRLLMHKSRFPSLSIHSISSSNNSDDDTIPCNVSARFTIRIVPHQTPEDVRRKLHIYFTYLFNKIQSLNKLFFEMTMSAAPWLAKTDDFNYGAAKNAIRLVYKQEAELIREGSSIPIVSELQRLSEKNVLLLPVGYSEHVVKNRDKMDVKTFMDGTKVVAAYIYELSQPPKNGKNKKK